MAPVRNPSISRLILSPEHNSIKLKKGRLYYNLIEPIIIAFVRPLRNNEAGREKNDDIFPFDVLIKTQTRCELTRELVYDERLH
jgi:hypothetical protein